MVLLITGPRWPALRWNRAGEMEPSSLASGKCPTIGSDVPMPSGFDFDREHTTNTSKVVWDSSLVLSKYIETLVTLLKIDLHSKRVLELGAGKGIVGMACAILGAAVTLTDAPEAIPSLKEVVEVNRLGAPPGSSSGSKGYIESVIALDWISWYDNLHYIYPKTSSQGKVFKGLPTPTFDFIVASDVIWVDWLVEPLIRTLTGLMNETTVAYLAYQQRGARCHPLFLKSMEENNLKFDPIPFQDLHPQYQLGDTIVLYKLKKDSAQ